MHYLLYLRNFKIFKMKKIFFLSIFTFITFLSCSSDESINEINQTVLKNLPPGTNEPTIPIDMGGDGGGGGSACSNTSRVDGNCDTGQFNGLFSVDCNGKLSISGSYNRNSAGAVVVTNLQAGYNAIVNNPTIAIISKNFSYISSNNWVIVTVNYRKTTLVYPLPPHTGPPSPVVTNHSAAFYLKPCIGTFN